MSVGIASTEKIPKKFSLSQNYPNPFNPITNIRYDIPVQIEVELIIYDILGKKVKTLIHQTLQPGFYEAIWDGTNERGLNVPSGMYFYRLNTPIYSKTYKMIFLR